MNINDMPFFSNGNVINNGGNGGNVSGGVQADFAQNDPTQLDYVKNRPFYDGRQLITSFSQTSTPNPPSYEVDGFGMTFYKISDLTPTKEEFFKKTTIVRSGRQENAYTQDDIAIENSDAIMVKGSHFYCIIYRAGALNLEYQGYQLTVEVPETGIYIGSDDGLPSGLVVDIYLGELKTLDIKYLPKNMALGYETKAFEDITWDGNTFGKPIVSFDVEMESGTATYAICKVSDVILTKNDYINAIVTIDFADGSEQEDVIGSQIVDITPNGSFAVLDSNPVFTIVQDNETADFDAIFGMGGIQTIPESGTWFVAGLVSGETMMYTKKLQASASVTKIDKKFLPDVLPEVSHYDNGKFLCVENGAWAVKTMSEWSGGSY